MNDTVHAAFIAHIKKHAPYRSLVYDYRTDKFTELRTQDMYEGYCAGVASKLVTVRMATDDGKSTASPVPHTQT